MKPGTTRWDTLLGCFESLLKSEEILHQMVNKRKFLSDAPQVQKESRQHIKETISDEDFIKNLKIGIHILKPINILTKKFQSDNVPISEVFYEFMNLPENYEQGSEHLSTAESAFIKEVIKVRTLSSYCIL